MADEKKNIFDKAIDALTNRDEKAALEKAKLEAETAKKETERLRARMAADKAAAQRTAAAKAAADKAAAQRTAAAKEAADKVTQQALAEARASKKIGVVTESLKLRSGPGEEFDPPIGWLKPDTKLEILEELEFWLKVKVEGKEGYVGKKYVKFASQADPGTKGF
jgi:SH3-like domain-containing protein